MFAGTLKMTRSIRIKSQSQMGSQNCADLNKSAKRDDFFHFYESAELEASRSGSEAAY